MNLKRWSYLLICFGGCLNFDDGGQSGSEDIVAPAGCTEVGADIVSPEALPAEVDFAAQELITASQGAWSGDLIDPNTGDPLQGVSMTVSYQNAPVRFVQFLASGFTADGTFVAGVPSDEFCPPQFEIPVSVQLSLEDGSLNESTEATIVSTSADFIPLSMQIPVEQLVGALQPTTFNAADFTSLSLGVTVFLQSQTWQGDISWSASREEQGPGGVVVVGTNETVGTVQMTRP